MSLRRRIGLLTALTVGVTVLIGSAITYAVVRGQLHGQIDDALRRQAQLATRVSGRVPVLPPGAPPAQVDIPAPPPQLGAPTAIQLLANDGKVVRLPFAERQAVAIPVTARDKDVASGGAAAYLNDRRVGETRLRVLTSHLSSGGAVQLARSLNATDDALAQLRLVLLALLAAGTLGGWLLGRALAGRAIHPIVELTDAVEHVELTGDLSRQVQVDPAASDDEVGRLARRFNAMLGRLDTTQGELAASVEAQRRLVADASHELRTPVTSLRTNAEILRERPDLPVPERAAMLDDVIAQAEELGLLVRDLMELAREGPGDMYYAELRLDEIAAAVARMQRHAPAARFTLDISPVVVVGDAERLARAINNLLDNAVSHGGGQVEVTVRLDGEVVVRDHGPGVAPGEEPHLFERFWRGTGARASPGSGLGLAIVRQVADAHGGSVRVESPPDGGALFRMRVPLPGEQ